MHRRIAVLVVAALSVALATALGLYAGPAYAVTGSAVSGLDTSVPGHVTGTVTSAEPFVFVRIATDVPQTPVTMNGGTGTFDLETWGFSGSQNILYQECSSIAPDPVVCGDETTSDVSFTPTETTPQVTWPADTTIGPGQTASVDVSDPNGGGTLQAVWVNQENGNLGTDLALNGTTALNLNDGSGYVHLLRCSAQAALQCSAFSPEISQNLEVRTTMTADVSGNGLLTTQVSSTQLSIATGRTGTYDLTWHLEDVNNPGVAVPGVGGEETGSLDGSGHAPLTIDRTGIPDGQYTLVGQISVQDPDFGAFANTALTGNTGLMIDTTGPAVDAVSVSAPTIYPNVASTKYPGQTTITVHGTGLDFADTLEVEDSTQAVVATLQYNLLADTATSSWDGRDGNGVLVPAGLYTLVVRDSAGNAAGIVGDVTVSLDHLLLKTASRNFTPGKTEVDRYVGRCSTLRRPSLHGWAGSYGYYANTKCGRQTARASSVSTVHAVKLAVLPNGGTYKDVRIDVYGGAATSRPASRGVLQYADATGSWTSTTVIRRAVGLHHGPTRSLSGLLQPGQVFAWNFLTAYGNRYDVKRFTITLRYYVLG